MNGPEHYREADRILGQWRAEATAAAKDGDTDRLEVIESMAASTMACAQVHATLALAAATANSIHDSAEGPLAEAPSGWNCETQVDTATWPEVLR